MPDKLKLNEVDKVEITTLIDNYIDGVAFDEMRDSDDEGK
jgi:hypothetical protein